MALFRGRRMRTQRWKIARVQSVIYYAERDKIRKCNFICAGSAYQQHLLTSWKCKSTRMYYTLDAMYPMTTSRYCDGDVSTRRRLAEQCRSNSTEWFKFLECERFHALHIIVRFGNGNEACVVIRGGKIPSPLPHLQTTARNFRTN